MLGKSHIVGRKGRRLPCEMLILHLVIIVPTGVICTKDSVVSDTVEAFKRSQCKTQRANKGRKNRDEVIFLAVNIWSVVSQEKNLSLLTPTARLILAGCVCSLQSYLSPLRQILQGLGRNQPRASSFKETRWVSCRTAIIEQRVYAELSGNRLQLDYMHSFFHRKTRSNRGNRTASSSQACKSAGNEWMCDEYLNTSCWHFYLQKKKNQ